MGTEESWTVVVHYVGRTAKRNARQLMARANASMGTVYLVAGGPGFPDIDAAQFEQPGWESHTYGPPLKEE